MSVAIWYREFRPAYQRTQLEPNLFANVGFSLLESTLFVVQALACSSASELPAG
jgi:hypothetical protein